MYKKVIGILSILTISCVVYAVSETSDSVSNNVSNQPQKPALTVPSAEDNKAALEVGVLDKVAIAALVENNTRLSVKNIKASIVAGLAEVHTDQGLFYASNDGQFFMQGKVYASIPGVGLTDMSELSMTQSRIEGLKQFEHNMIVYPAKDEKHVVTVFTDITCGYCVRLHSQMQGYNDLGITVRYMAYPRQGATGQVADQMAAIWASDDPKEAMHDAKVNRQMPASGKNLAEQKQIIAKQYQLGRELGINGTPAIALESGEMVSGYLPPAQLLQRIEQ